MHTNHYYQAAISTAAGCVVAGVLWGGFIAMAWRPWMQSVSRSHN
jgi:hypothetical protein